MSADDPHDIDWSDPLPGLTRAQSRGVRAAALLGMDAETLACCLDQPVDADLALRRAKAEQARMEAA